MEIPQGVAIASSPAAVYQSVIDRVHCFVVGADGNLWDNYWDAAAGVWQWESRGNPSLLVPNVAVASPPAAIYQSAIDSVHCFVVGTDFQLYDNYWDGAAGAWQWEALLTPTNVGFLAGGLSPAYRSAADSVLIFAIGADGNLYLDATIAQWGWSGLGPPS